MKAIAVVPSKHEVKIVAHEEPSIKLPTDVKLRMLEVGVCGTDKEICSFQYGTPPPDAEHLIIGHESLGEIIEVGSAVKNLKAGQFAVPMVRRPCPHVHCTACRVDRQDFCYTGDFTERGIKERHGFMTEYIVDDEKYIVPIPHQLRAIGVLVEPLTIAEKAITQLWQVQQRLPWACEIVPGKQRGHCRRAVVLGAGPVGLLGAMAFVAADFDTYVYSRSPAPNPRSMVSEAIGAKYVSSEVSTPQQLADEVGNIDVVYEAVGASSIAFQVMKVLGTNGVFIFTGVPGRRGPTEIDTDLLMRNLVLKNQVVFGTVNANRDAFENAIRDLQIFQEKWPEIVPSLITGRYPIEEHRELLLGKAGGIKNLIEISAN